MHAPEGFVAMPGTERASPTGVVFDVAPEGGGTTCVCKRLSARAGDEAWVRARLVAEGELLARLAAHGTPGLVASGQDAYGPWLVLERVEGRTLTAWIGAADAAWVARAAGAAFEALARVHGAGVVHGDVSPDNVVVADDGARATMLDFGLALWAGAPPMPEGPFRGTLLYAAPEVARGEAPDARSDVFAMGASLLHVASGVAPRAEATQAAMLLAAGEESVEPWARRAAAPLPKTPGEALVACCAFDRAARPLAGALCGPAAGISWRERAID